MRIAIVNDMTMAVECLRRAVAASRHDVAWLARDGLEALTRNKEDKPDLILMDLFMPVMDGVEATRRIMAEAPCPIVVVTSSVEDHAARAFEAMGYGALDAVNTPTFGLGTGIQGTEALLQKIDTIEKLIKYDSSDVVPFPTWKAKQSVTNAVPLVAIGASSGGPQVLADVLSHLPATFNAAVVVVQHVDAFFAGELAVWLNNHCQIKVRTAPAGQLPTEGEVLIAQTNDHLVLDEMGRLDYTRHPDDLVFRPSVDVFFSSVARYWKGSVLGMLLTGMGSDGAQGLLKLRKSGHFTLAQDKASSAVYGMPKAAAESGAAAKILPIDGLAAEMLRWERQSLQHRGIVDK